MEHTGPVLVVDIPHKEVWIRPRNQGPVERVETKFLDVVFSASNSYQFIDDTYEIVCVSHRPPGHHYVDCKFHEHNCVHHVDDMKNVGHAIPIGEQFPDATCRDTAVRRVYLRKTNTD